MWCTDDDWCGCIGGIKSWGDNDGLPDAAAAAAAAIYLFKLLRVDGGMSGKFVTCGCGIWNGDLLLFWFAEGAEREFGVCDVCGGGGNCCDCKPPTPIPTPPPLPLGPNSMPPGPLIVRAGDDGGSIGELKFVIRWGGMWCCGCWDDCCFFRFVSSFNTFFSWLKRSLFFFITLKKPI